VLTILDKMTCLSIRVLMLEFVLTPFLKVYLLIPLLVLEGLDLGTIEK
jgi:hypothetical protein